MDPRFNMFSVFANDQESDYKMFVRSGEHGTVRQRLVDKMLKAKQKLD